MGKTDVLLNVVCVFSNAGKLKLSWIKQHSWRYHAPAGVKIQTIVWLAQDDMQLKECLYRPPVLHIIARTGKSNIRDGETAIKIVALNI